MSSVRQERLYRIRELEHRDLADVAAIERCSYEFPWSQGVFRDCLLAGYQCLAVDYDERLAGYGILSIAAGEAHVLNLCVSQTLRGFGFGAALLDAMINRARVSEAERILLEVRPSNAHAIRLYERRGFARIGSRRNYYQAAEGREDALVYALQLTRRSV
ncbi:MAG: ribosomal protein S18-alanine N-acetyltransferase [Pseudomonadota bacterium]